MPSSAQAVAHFIKKVSTEVLVRPYLATPDRRLEINVESFYQNLPTPGHYAISNKIVVDCLAGDDKIFYKLELESELIVVLTDIADDTVVNALLEMEFPKQLFSDSRPVIASLTRQTGYGEVHLPPVNANLWKAAIQLKALEPISAPSSRE